MDPTETPTGDDPVSTVATYARSPRDLLRSVVLGAATLVVVALTEWATDGVIGVETDLVALVSGLPTTAARVTGGAATAAATLAVIGTWLVPFVTRRFRLLGYVAAANLTSALLWAGLDAWIDHGEGSVLANELGRRADLDAAELLDVRVIVQLAASLTVLGPFVGRAWRRAGAGVLAALVLVRVVVSVELPVEIFAGVLLGLTVGSLVLLVLGRPTLRPTAAAIRAALGDAGLDVRDVRVAPVAAGGSTLHLATTPEGGALHVEVLGEDERAADLLLRAYRFLRLKNVGDPIPYPNLRRAVEHEALVALAARDVGVRTPRLRAVAAVGTDAMLLAYDQLDGRSLAELDDADVTDDLVRRTWEQVALLRRRRIAHRDLRRANVVVDAHGAPWIVDFGFSELAATQAQLDGDVAQLLASFAVVVGPARSAALAVEALGVDAVAAALPRLQMRALSGATRSALSQQDGLLDDLQRAVAERCGIDEVVYEELSRVTARRLFTIAMLAAVTYFLLPQLADLPAIADQIRDASWWWFAPILLASGLTYLGAAAALVGAVPERIPPGPTVLAQVGSSFASKVAPAGLGGMALNVRFLQKQGVPEPVAVSSVGLDAGAGVIGHVVMLLVFLVWAGRDAFSSFRLPDPTLFLLVGAALLAAGLIALAVPPTRRLATEKLLPVLLQGLGGVAAVVRRPGKVAALVGGSAFTTACYLAAAFLSVQAFGGGLPFATVGACYLVGSAVATAAPTPGGLGAVEVALIASLTAAGLDDAVAVPAVFLFRVATFWVPILPGWAAFTWLRRSGDV